jgi:hypothetical protein
VQRQSVRTDHLLVADGHPQDWIDRTGVRHLRLDRPHRDFGNTPRGIGAVLAAAEGYPAISLLDADNWLQPDHVEACLSAAGNAQGGPCDFVVTRRNFVGPDGARIEVEDEPPELHVDTNCFFFLEGAFHTLPAWVLMPPQLSPICDRTFWASLASQGLTGADTGRATVNYYCIWEPVFRAAGLVPPPEAKPPIDAGPAMAWLNGLDDRGLELVSRRLGSKLQRGR